MNTERKYWIGNWFLNWDTTQLQINFVLLLYLSKSLFPALSYKRQSTAQIIVNIRLLVLSTIFSDCTTSTDQPTHPPPPHSLPLIVLIIKNDHNVTTTYSSSSDLLHAPNLHIWKVSKVIPYIFLVLNN